jgi:hypothetical protein
MIGVVAGTRCKTARKDGEYGSDNEFPHSTLQHCLDDNRYRVRSKPTLQGVYPQASSTRFCQRGSRHFPANFRLASVKERACARPRLASHPLRARNEGVRH